MTSRCLAEILRQKAFLKLHRSEQLAIILFVLHTRFSPFAQYVKKAARKTRKELSFQKLIMCFWTETSGASRKTYLPAKHVKKRGKRKGSVIRPNYDLQQLNLPKALAFLAETHRADVVACLGAVKQTSKRCGQAHPDWTIPGTIGDVVTWPTPCHHLMAPHVEDALVALRLTPGEKSGVQRKWWLGCQHRQRKFRATCIEQRV